MSSATNNSKDERIKLLSSGVTSIEIYSDQENNEYYIGEDITITAKFDHPSVVLAVDWQLNGYSFNNNIDTKLEKYAGTGFDKTKHKLRIKKCCELDAGVYSLVAACRKKVDVGNENVGFCDQIVNIYSDKLVLKVVQGLKVALSEELSADFNSSVEFIAKIRCYPKHNSVIWKKGKDPIDITLPKYVGSSDVGDCPVLCINNVKEEDRDVYSIEVQNADGKSACKGKLVLKEDCPEVALNEKELSADFNTCAKFVATIQSFPKHNCVIWKKGEDPIDINLLKYVGSSDVGDYPVLCINNVKEEDGDVYSVEVQNAVEKSTCSGKLVVKEGLPEVTLNDALSAVFNKCTEILAAIQSFPKHDRVIWKKGEDPIDIGLSKYAGSSNDGDRPILFINNIKEDDEDVYSVEVQNAVGKRTCSGKLVVIGDCPEVALNEEITAVSNTCVEFKATIQSFPKHNSVIWKKGEDQIDITLSKYAGSSDVGDRPTLYINNVKKEDVDVYSVEVQNAFGKRTSRGKLEIKEDYPVVTLNDALSGVFNKCTEIIATIQSFPKHDIVIWKKGEDPIDIRLPKYAGSSAVGDRPILFINNIKEDDEDVYSIEVQNAVGKGTCSGKLVVIGDSPEIALNEVPSAVFNDCVEFKATIQSFPKHNRVIWKKGEDPIDITLPKYVGSSDLGDRPILCINNIKAKDDDVYSIEVQNAYGKRRCCGKLVVKEVSQMIIISGPVVVSSSETIHLQILLTDQITSNGKWWKIKDRTTTEIKFDDKKYCKYPSTNKIEIHKADKEDSAAYQFSWNDMKSNRINIFVDDSGVYATCNLENCLRLFALQSVSAEAMRNVFENEADFIAKKNKLPEYRGSNRNRNVQRKGDQNLTLNNVDISLMYRILRNSVEPGPKGGWGKIPCDNDIDLPDDIERIRHCRNLICHSDASEIETTEFNESVLDLVGAIRRLSKNNVKIIEDTFDIMNRVFTKGEDMQAMMEKLNDFKREQNEDYKRSTEDDINISKRSDRARMRIDQTNKRPIETRNLVVRMEVRGGISK